MGKSIIGRDIGANIENIDSTIFKSLFENSISGILFGNPDNGNILDANMAAAEIFGYSIEELRKLNRNDIFDFKHPSMIDSLKKRKVHGSASGELIGIRKNGKRFPCEFSSSIFKNQNGEHRTSTTLTDITERKRNEEEIALLLNNTEESFVLIDAKLKIVSFNRQFNENQKKYFDKGVEKGDSILDYTQEKDKKETQNLCNNILNGGIIERDVVLRDKYGIELVFRQFLKPALDLQNNLIGIFITSIDVTEKRKAQLKLKHNSELFKKLTSKIPAALYQFELSPCGKMTFPYVSKGISLINPTIDAELLKKDASSAFATIYPDDLPNLFKSIETSINNLTDWECEFRSVLDDNRIAWIKGSSSPEMKSDGTKTWYGYFQDITDQKNNDKSIRESKERYEIIAKATNDTIWDWDLKTNKIVWNKGIIGVFGYKFVQKEAETDIDWWFSKIHPQDIIRVKKKIELRIANQENRWVDEYRFLCFDGTYKYVLDRGFLVVENSVPVRMIGAMQDITDRKKHEEELRTSEQQFRTIFEGVPACVKIVDLNGKLIEINKAGLALLEAETIDQAKSQPLFNYLLPQYQKSFVNIHSRTVSGENCALEFEMLGLKGTKRWLETHTVPMKDSNEQIVKILAITQDVSHFKLSEKALQESEVRYRTMIECSPESIAVHSHGKIVFVNPTAIKLFGARSSDDLIGKSIFDIVHPDFHDMTYTRIKNTIKGIPNNLKDNYKLVMLDGTVKDIVSEGTAIVYDGEPSVHVVMKDITKQKQEEHHLKLLESVITNTLDAVIITDSGLYDEEGPKIIFVNQAFTVMTGYSFNEVIGKSPRLLRGPKSDLNELKRLKEAIKKQESCEITSVNYKKNGEELWINLSVSPVFDDKNNLTHWISVERDITQKKKDDIEREHIIAELSQNNKDLKQFSYVTSHNLRAPIANLLGLTSLIDQYKIPNKSLKQIIDGVRQSALMFDDTVKDLTKVLIIKDQTNIVKEEVSFVLVIENVLKQLSIAMDDNTVKINYEFSNAPCVLFTPSYMESILLNLFTNALKYKSLKRNLKIDIISSNVEGFVILKFKDNGLGIDTEKYKDKLFKLYQRFHDNPDGKGLGLYLVKSQLEVLGGSIAVESEVGKGTTFIMKFRK